MAVERVSGNVEADIFGKHDWQLVVRHRHRTACFAVDDRNRRAPISLPANAPVAKAVLSLAITPAFGFSLGDDVRFGGFDRHAVQEMRIHNTAGAGIRDIAAKIAVSQVTVGNNASDAQIIFAREVQIALVMRRAAEYRAGAIIHQHKVRDINGQMPARIERMFNRQASAETHFLGSIDIRRGRPTFTAFLDESLQFGGVGSESLCNRMVCRNCNKAGTKHRVGPRSKNVNAPINIGAARTRKCKAAF